VSRRAGGVLDVGNRAQPLSLDGQLDDFRVAAANELRLMFEVHCRDLFFRCCTTLNVIEEIQQYGDMVW
jgi:hypothetical protein